MAETLERQYSDNPNRTRRLLLAMGTAGAVVLAGCGGGGGDDTETTGRSGQTAASSLPGGTESAPVPVPRDQWVDFTFDYLGGNSTIIRTYDTPYAGGDAHTIGTYPDGETHQAACKVEDGRVVPSVPPEAPLERDEFVLFYDGAEVNFATATYIKNPDEVLGQLQPCPAEFVPMQPQ